MKHINIICSIFHISVKATQVPKYAFFQWSKAVNPCLSRHKGAVIACLINEYTAVMEGTFTLRIVLRMKISIKEVIQKVITCSLVCYLKQE